jgi:hypothetical protein
MMKPASITALQTFFLIKSIDSLLPSVEKAPDTLQATWVERLGWMPLLVPFVRILTISNNEQVGQ